MNPLYWKHVVRRLSRLVAALSLVPVCAGSLWAQGTPTVTVDGLSGAIISSTDWNDGVFYPGQKVAVRVVNADMLRYAYTISAESTAIQRQYDVIGVPGNRLLDMVAQMRSPTTAVADKNRDASCLNAEAKAGLDTLRRYLDTAAGVAGAIDNIKAGIVSLIKDDRAHWDSERIEALLGSAAAARYWLDSVRAYFQALVAPPCPAIKSGDTCCPKTRDQLAKSVKDVVEDATTALAKNTAQLRSWLGIMRTTGQPVMCDTVRIGQTAQQYVVTVHRDPLSQAGSSSSAGEEMTAASGSATVSTGNGEGAAKPVAPARCGGTAFAVIRFEGYTRSRFVFAIGFAGHGEDRTITFSPFVKRSAVYTHTYRGDTLPPIRTDTAVVDSIFYRTHAAGGRAVVTPIITLGVYFGGVDDLSDDLTWSRLYAFVGFNMEFPLSRYFLGVNYDFPMGVAVGGGVVSRREESLAEAWAAGSDQITEATRATLVKPPVDVQTRLGVFFNISFRPVFLTNLFGLIKKAAGG